MVVHCALLGMQPSGAMSGALRSQECTQLFDYNHYLRYVDTIFKRAGIWEEEGHA
jgi:hypothetical protein